jgi:starvation-inducible DNA-binding protein
MNTHHMRPTRIDLAPATREAMVELLNRQLADTLDLYTQTKQAHWNVTGAQFQQLHELFDELAGQLIGHLDLLAERATALGGAARGTLRMAAAVSRLPEMPAGFHDGLAVVRLLADRYAALAASTRAAIETATRAGDAATADLFTEISRALDKALWFLEAHLQA